MPNWCDVAEHRKLKPRPLAKLYGTNGPTPEQAEAWAEAMRKWSSEHRKLRKLAQAEMEASNAAFRAS